LPKCYIYECSKAEIIIFPISAPQNAVKKLSNFVKSPMGEISFTEA